MSLRIQLRALIAVAALATATVLCAADKAASDGVIYPRNAAAAESKEGAKTDTPGNTTLLLLAVVAAGAGAWFLWKQRQGGSLPGAERKLSIAESRSLGNRQYLVVADYDGRKFLLGVCPGRIEMLTKLDDELAGDELP